MPLYSFYYIPGAYVMKIRMTTLFKKIGLVCYHIIPACFLFFYFEQLSVFGVFKFAMLLVAFYALYEIGYIYNDTETIKRETTPTLRLSNYQLSYYSSNKHYIYGVRGVLFVLLLIVSCNISKDDSFWLCFIFCVIEFLIFQIYNSVRGAVSIPVFFVLETFKYIPFLVAHPTKISYILLLGVMAIYAIPNTIERISFPRYGCSFMMNLLPTKKSYLYFRVLYCCLCVIIFWLLNLFGLWVNRFVYIFLFLLLFRSSAMTIQKDK